MKKKSAKPGAESFLSRFRGAKILAKNSLSNTYK